MEIKLCTDKTIFTEILYKFYSREREDEHKTFHFSSQHFYLHFATRRNEDETQAFHYHLESYRYCPTDMNVITWLGIYYVKQEMYEQ